MTNRYSSGGFELFVGIALGLLVSVANAQGITAADIDRARFKVSTKGTDGKWTSRETDRVPLTPGEACYNWGLHLSKTPPGDVAWTEELEIPAKPAIWQHSDKFELSKERTVAVTKKSQTPKDGWISHGWCVAKGDPAGRYVIKVYVGEGLAKTFEFFVE